ncbi:MAG: hypothetical protein JJT96_13085 [Opitutales bacterium]|nr:hypothetical protein [Opitutales bacterium]
MSSHPTQIFMHNPQGLRVEYLLDDEQLLLWWSPLAGQSTAAHDRNFSNRDDHLEVFASITLPGCGLEAFARCDYDPYHSVLHFGDRALHLLVRPDAPALILWSEASKAKVGVPPLGGPGTVARPPEGGTPTVRPQDPPRLIVDLKSDRYDEVFQADDRCLVLRHNEPAHIFEFVAALGPGGGTMRHSPFRGKWTRHYTQAVLAPGQVFALGVGLEGEGAAGHMRELATVTPQAHLAAIEAALAPVEAMGRTSGGTGGEAHAFRTSIARGLHSMIDESGAFRASLKAIYYLIWVRDAGFAFAYQAAAGWPHKLRELCRLLLDNPTVARGAGIPEGRMFAQLIHPDYGKYEEDGIYYVLWTLFTHWTQTGERTFLEGADRALLEEAIAWVERRCFDAKAGLFGGYFADETPAYRSRDYGWDYAIGQPAGDEHIRHEGHRVVRSYDLYLNTLLHTAYSMLAAMSAEVAKAEGYSAKAARLWEHLQPLYADRSKGLPPYGDLLCEDGERRRARPWGPASSTYIWALAMPNFLPLEDRDALHKALLDAILEKPEMHWINGICAAVAAADPWVHGEARLLAVLERVRAEAMTPGKCLPMGGAMPEKLGAPEGNLYHDIRPQGFAMAAWLGAWASLGLRRLPYGLALRPTTAFERLENYPWRGSVLHFVFGPSTRALALEVEGRPILHTLQVPTNALRPGEQTVRLIEAPRPGGPLLLRSTVELHSVQSNPGGNVVYRIRAYGPAEMILADMPERVLLRNDDGLPVPFTRFDHADRSEIRFSLRGPGELVVGV